MTRFLIVFSLPFLFTILAGEIDAQNAREGYFNNSRALLPPIKLNKHIALSFRSCNGGQLFSQRSSPQSLYFYSIQLEVRADGLLFNITIMSKSFVTRISAPLLDNQWHNINILYRMGNLTISSLGHSQIIANSTYNSEILQQPELVSDGDVLVIGELFDGCLLEGPNIVFNTSNIQSHNVIWGPCQMRSDPCTTINPCATDPCMHRGQCIKQNNAHFICKCSSRFSGPTCQIDDGPPCDKHPCQNGGTCNEDPLGEYSCYCLGGWAGKNCNVRVDNGPCESNMPCQNNATCIRLGNGQDYRCTCPPGFEGKDCDINTNECLELPCKNGGLCVDGVNSYSCLCDRTGYMGTNCEININECENNPCLNNGICFDNYGGYTCQCAPGFGGQNCEQKLNDCSVSRCPNPNMMCVDGTNNIQCVCKPGFSGDDCDIVADEWCDPCINGGVYMRTGEGYFCLCKPGFSGEDCSVPLSCVAKPCHHASACYDFPGGYFCACEAGWTGLHCDQLLTNHCTPNPCKNGEHCTQSLTDFFCSCPEGLSGPNCETGLMETCMTRTCMNGGTCTDGLAGVSCNCTADWMGPSCELPFSACGPPSPCHNNGTCISKNEGKGYYCECHPGYEGENCENNQKGCVPNKCPDGKMCIDGANSFECVCPPGTSGPDCIPDSISPCSPNPCQNQGACKENQGNHTCECTKGWEGFDCSIDVDECNLPGFTPCQNNGLCVNRNGTYECYCKGGFSGVHCEFDVDECLSRPCLNGATCENRVNAFLCLCAPGYTGLNCEKDIDECMSNPCLNGATCRDEIATYVCECPPGFTGRRCDMDIDDCASSPCQNHGRCKDGRNMYTCDCTNTGFEGDHCEINIDECASAPCMHGGTCVDGINSYECRCQPGYQSRNCELDIIDCEPNPCHFNSSCWERSIESYYLMKDPNLPEHFNQTFDYSLAAGYDCVCVKGSTGKNCEININECESNPCENKANCRDELDGFTCECEPGFEGTRCEVNIDECARYTPCVHGTCVDGIAQYTCECDGNYGGKNCSVELVGCQVNECQNNGTCIPYLEGETIHKFNCSCVSGYQGMRCERSTTMSFNGSSYAAFNTSRDEGYSLQFRFRTTLSEALLTVGKGNTYYFLIISGGRLTLITSLLNKLDGVSVGTNLNNSEWQKVFVAINSSHVVLAANEEQTIYPISLNNIESSTASYTTFPVTYLGGVVNSLRKYTANYVNKWMIGCMQDTMVNGQWILPPSDETASIPVSYVGVESGCQREEQCTPNPCHGHGICTDYWNVFKCDCTRPFLGSTCQYNYTAATFGYENITDSRVTVTVDPSARRAVRSVLDISMFIRTREPSGGIFYLGSRPSSVNYSDETVIAAKLINGELKVSFQFNGMLEVYGVDGVRLDNGFNHLIQVVRNVTTVQVKINGTEYFRKTISATGPLDLQILVLGSANNTSYDSPNNPSVRNFKGVIQDVQMNSGPKQMMILEFYPLIAPDIPEHERPMSIGLASFNSSLVLEGIVSDDACQSQPCAHGGTCVVTWNDFYCQCTVGHKGKQCEEMEFCQVQDCPDGSECRNLNTGYECVANITIHDPKEDVPGLHYQFVKGDALASLLDISVTYRSKTGGTILQIGPSDQGSYLHIHIYNDQVNVFWNIDGIAGRQNMTKDPPDGAWTTISLTMVDNTITGRIFGGMEESTPQMFPPSNFSTAQWDNLVRSTMINIGGRRSDLGKLAYTTAEGVQSNDVELASNDQRFGEFFLGCIGEVRIGSLLLPYFTQAELNNSNSSNKDHFEMTDDSSLGDALLKGCSLCFDTECHNGGNCSDPENQYTCTCPIGFEGNVCETDIDECLNNHDCLHNSTCVDRIGAFTCTCLEGYQGELCEFETNECLSNPCKNGGVCIDRLARFECNCTSDFVGPTCDQARQITCLDNPCHNHGLCTDVKNPANADNFTCTCEEGFVGFWCESPFCEIQPCAHGDCVNKLSKPICSCHPGFGGKNCDIDLNECESNPCEHGGKCIDGIASFTCDCWKTGFRGPTCSEDINECVEIGEEICDNGGTCRNMQGTYLCVCPEGFCGANCTYKDPCFQSVDTFVCFNDGKCKAVCIDEPDYTCECTDSFTGKNCTDPVSFSSSRVADIALIVVPIFTIILLAGVISLFVFLMMARKKRATRGTYSPSSQEYCNPRVELDNVMKPPPEERLI